ncbi:MAG: crossover junction endodeoxyribonuclease RuvC [Chloroflexota bacterium]
MRRPERDRPPNGTPETHHAMRILGIDPGSIHCGYGLIAHTTPRQRRTGTPAPVTQLLRYSYLSSGRIVLPQSRPLHVRLREMYTSLSDVIADFRPDEIVIERMFFAKGTKSAISLGHTRGVVLLAASLSGITIYEYSPLEVKKAVVGYGRADKRQTELMVRQILKISHHLSPDSADALALALCHAQSKEVLAAAGKPGMQTPRFRNMRRASQGRG